MCLSQESHANAHNHHFHRHHLFLRLCTHRAAFKSCHTFLDYSLASTILSRCCRHHLQGSLPVIKVTVVIIVVIAFATSIADDSPDQIYFSPGHQPGRFRSLVSANGQGSSFQLLFRSSKISPSTLHFPFALIPNLIRTNLQLGLFLTRTVFVTQVRFWYLLKCSFNEQTTHFINEKEGRSGLT